MTDLFTLLSFTHTLIISTPLSPHALQNLHDLLHTLIANIHNSYSKLLYQLSSYTLLQHMPLSLINPQSLPCLPHHIATSCFFLSSLTTLNLYHRSLSCLHIDNALVCVIHYEFTRPSRYSHLLYPSR